MELCKLKTPCYVVDEEKLIHNLEILNRVERNTGCRILLAQKAFSFFLRLSSHWQIYQRRYGKRPV